MSAEPIADDDAGVAGRGAHRSSANPSLPTRPAGSAGRGDRDPGLWPRSRRDRRVLGVAVAAEQLEASVATSVATSEAKHLAAEEMNVRSAARPPRIAR